jgi:outer membrane receptor protein involved in Fe transport
MVSSEDLDLIAPGNLVEGMNTLPQFFASQTPNSADSWFLRGGYGMLNLRGLGINRTLTLLDGRRMTSSTAFGGVDINLIPEAVIKRVETVTGGASAAYGTDAVAGVVNFILDHDFEGFDVHAQSGTTQESDADNWEASATFGTDIGSAGHIVVSIEQAETDGVDRLDSRDWYRAWGLVPDASGMLVRYPDVVSRNATFSGLIIAPGSSLNGMEFNPSGTAVTPFQTSSVSGFPLGIPPARHSITNGGSGDDSTLDMAVLAPESQRASGFAYLEFEATPSFTVYVQGLAGQSMTDQPDHGGRFANVPGIDTRITIYRENAFLPAAVRQIMVNENLASFQMNVVGSRADLGRESRLKQDNHTYSGTLGFEWYVPVGPLNGWQVDGYAQYGTANNKGYQQGILLDRISAAVDAVVNPANGQIVCRAALINPAMWGYC